ncbi:MAG: serine hydrolase domain-containing protein [Planctomycetota bacterium]
MPTPARRASTLLAVVAAALPLACGAPRTDATNAPALTPWPERAYDATELELLALMHEHHVPGLAAALVHDGAITRSYALGWADVERRVPVEPDTLFQLASISKTVTATVVMQLVERGAIDLDADVGRYLPFALRHPVHPDVPITPRMLLTHSSSIRDDWDVLEGTWVQDRDYPLTLAESMEAYFTPSGRFWSPEENFEEWAPGERTEYCNVAFALLAYVAERAAGEPFETLVRERVLEPLDLEGGFRLHEVDVARVAKPYVLEEGDRLVSPGHHAYLDFPSGTLRLSAIDLATFLCAYQCGGELRGARILRPDTVAAMLTVQDAALDPDQGLAWYRSDALDDAAGDRGDGDWWGHDGGDPGVATQMLWDRDSGDGVVLLVNTEPEDWAIETALLEALLRR